MTAVVHTQTFLSIHQATGTSTQRRMYRRNSSGRWSERPNSQVDLRLTKLLQNEALLSHDSFHVSLRYHWPFLRCGFTFHWLTGHVHSHWQLPLWIRGLACVDLPGHHYLSHDVCSNSSSTIILAFIQAYTVISAVYVQARSGFKSNGQDAKLGVKAFAFMWTASACLFLSCLMYCLGGAVGRKDDGYSGRKERRRGFFNSARSNSVRSQKKESYA